MREKFDLSERVRGEYAERYAEGTNLVRLEPDVAKAFPTSQAVNKALRGIARRSAEPKTEK